MSCKGGSAMKQRTNRKSAQRVFEGIFLLCFGVLNLIPIFWGLITSLKSARDINIYPPRIFNFTPVLDHYKTVLSTGFFQTILNSAIYAIIAIVLGVVIGYLAGYGFARRNFPLKKLAFFLVVVGIPLSGGSSVLLIPNYMYMMNLGLTNHWYTLPMIYIGYNLPMTIWLMISGIKSVPIELEEAARIDGAKQSYIICRLLPPLVKPSAAAAALLIFINAWNDYITASVMVNDPHLKNIQMAIYDYMGFFGKDWGPLTAAATCAIVPILLVFTFLGKQLISGLTAGAVKG